MYNSYSWLKAEMPRSTVHYNYSAVMPRYDMGNHELAYAVSNQLGCTIVHACKGSFTHVVAIANPQRPGKVRVSEQRSDPNPTV